MNGLPRDLVAHVLRQPQAVHGLDAPSWDLLIRQARRAGLLARIAALLRQRGLTDRVPPAPRLHLEAAEALARAHHAEVRREVNAIQQALRPLGLPVILLKGAAYLWTDLPPAAGRLFSDIDILVPKPRLAAVEAALMSRGWATTHHSPYDQRYYRTWMHELPPLRHIHRQTVLDVHHAILPETSRLKPSAAKLIAASRDAGRDDGVRTLAPVDMVLHSMAHLFHNEELSHGLRDLSDLDLLLRHHAAEPGFWPALTLRAQELDLERPLHYGLNQTHRLLGTPVPQDRLDVVRAMGPGWPLSHLMDALWSRALRPHHRSVADWLTPVALFLLYVRAHWLRMPPLLLLQHLSIKALRRHEDGPVTP